MDREIKFRGLRTDGKGWVYGCLVQPALINSGMKYISESITCIEYEDDGRYVMGRFISVAPESVGQLTGFVDIHDSEIYEGDIIMDIIVGLKSEIVFTSYGNFGLKPIVNEGKDLQYEIIDPSWMCTTTELKGNIHEPNKSRCCGRCDGENERLRKVLLNILDWQNKGANPKTFKNALIDY